MSEWKEYKLGELCQRVTSGGTPNTRKNEYYGGEIPWVRTQEVNFNRIYDTEIKITKQGLENSSAKWIPENSVIIAMYGATAGKVAINKIPLTTNQACCNLIINELKADYRFVYYNILSRFSSIANMAVGGAQQNLNAGMIKDLNISTPPLPTQTAIAEILSSLDDKIELNNKINQELENLAQTLFKQWFIDFEFPNENGEPYKSSGGEMVDSELGEIPKGWEVYRFKEIVSKYIDNRGKTPPIANDGIPLVEVRQMVDTGIYPSLRTDKFLSKEVYDTFLRGHLLKDDILMSTVGTIGRLNIVPDFQIFAIAQNVLGIRFNKDLTSQLFMFCLMRTKDFNDEINSRLIETVQSSIKRSDLEKIPVILPKLILVERFDSLIRDIFDRIKNSALEIEELTNLRDILLSKLISGELHVTSKKTNTNYKLS